MANRSPVEPPTPGKAPSPESENFNSADSHVPTAAADAFVAASHVAMSGHDQTAQV
jgi:hypothetical protein